MVTTKVDDGYPASTSLKPYQIHSKDATYSVDSIKGDDGIIINIQFVRIVVMMNNENSG